MAVSREMTYQECEELLRGGVVGRVAVSTPDGPHLIPLNYAVVDDAIILRTTPYSLLATYGRNAVLAFETDHFDYETQQGWSVLARGRADIVTDVESLQHIRETWTPRPWADGNRNLYIRIPWRELTGRRLGDGWTHTNELPVRRTTGWARLHG